MATNHDSDGPPTRWPSRAATRELLHRFRAGDEKAYAVLFKRYEGKLKNFIRGHTDAPLARIVPPDDLLQETHLEAVRSLGQFTYRRELSFFFWLCGIARNCIHRHCRRLRRRPPATQFSARSDVTSDELISNLPALDPSPSEQAGATERLELVATALHALPPGQRAAVTLRYFEGHDNVEAAAIAGIRPTAFRVQLSKGLVRLREALAEQLGESDPPTRSRSR